MNLATTISGLITEPQINYRIAAHYNGNRLVAISEIYEDEAASDYQAAVFATRLTIDSNTNQRVN